jgi:hypothetical protein
MELPVSPGLIYLSSRSIHINDSCAVDSSGRLVLADTIRPKLQRQRTGSRCQLRELEAEQEEVL